MWRILFALALVLLLVVTFVYAYIGVPVLSPQFLIGMFLALLIWAIPASQLSLLECPRCHRRFFWHLGMLLIVFFLFQSRCSHCRLPQYADDSLPTKEI
jgi:hypothetical protein